MKESLLDADTQRISVPYINASYKDVDQALHTGAKQTGQMCSPMGCKQFNDVTHSIAITDLNR